MGFVCPPPPCCPAIQRTLPRARPRPKPCPPPCLCPPASPRPLAYSRRMVQALCVGSRSRPSAKQEAETATHRPRAHPPTHSGCASGVCQVSVRCFRLPPCKRPPHQASASLHNSTWRVSHAMCYCSASTRSVLRPLKPPYFSPVPPAIAAVTPRHALLSTLRLASLSVTAALAAPPPLASLAAQGLLSIFY